MDIKHIAQEKINRKNEHYSVSDDYIMVELFGTMDYKLYMVSENNFNHNNSDYKTFKGLPVLISRDGRNPLSIDFDFNVSETSLYRVDVLYEQYNNIYSIAEVTDQHKINTSKDLQGEYLLTSKKDKIIENVSKITETTNKFPDVVNKKIQQQKNITNLDEKNTLLFDGENDVNKRKILNFELSQGQYNLQIRIPVNCYFKGIILRKINRYYANNLDEKGTNLLLHECNINNSNMTSPTEASIAIAYDHLLENTDNVNGLNLIKNDECNIYVKNMNGKVFNNFGGYIHNISENNKQFKITCKDRLKDMENNYIMDELKIQGGTSKDEEHSASDIHSFNNYRELIKHLCQLTENSIKSNIPALPKLINHENCTILTFGKKKDIKKVKTSHGKVKINNNNIVLRNESSGLKRQVFHVFHHKNGIRINEFNNFHIHLGMGNPKTSYKYKETTDTELENAGAVNWTKCGVSPDKKYVTGIGQGSAGKTSAKYRTGYWRSIFVNKCPNCGRSHVLRWDSGRSTTKCIYTQNWNGSKRKWDGGIPETEITCTSCDSDFDAVSGWEKISGSKKKLKSVKIGLKSSKKEQDLLHKGKLTAPYNSNVRVSADDVFRAIKKSCKGYTYSTNGSTARYLDKHGNGDCHAWSEKIFNELKKYKVDCIIKEYKAESNNHRSVLYRNSNGDWEDFPYREYNFPKMVRNTSNSKNGKTIQKYTDGGRINQAVNTSSVSSKTQTTEVTVTQGYDITAPFKAYIELTLSLNRIGQTNTKTHKVYFSFTLDSPHTDTITGLKPLFINNVHQIFTLNDLKSKLETFFTNEQKVNYIQLYDIKFITPPIEIKNEDNEVNEKSTWYTNDKTTHDHSSCKMKLYEIRFDNQTETDPLSLQSCGKTVSEIMNKIITDEGYLTHMVYGKHRSDDVLYFDDDLSDNPLLVLSDDDIMSIGEVNYTPDIVNMSKYIFKKNDNTGKYNYVEYCNLESILLYGENEMINQNDRDTGISSKEAHWFNRRLPNFKPVPEFQYSLTIKGLPSLNIGEYVHVNTDLKRFNSVLQVRSLNMTYKRTNRPSITTEIGLNEVENKLHIRDILKNIIKDKNKFNIKDNINQVDPADRQYEWEY